MDFESDKFFWKVECYMETIVLYAILFEVLLKISPCMTGNRTCNLIIIGETL